MNFEILDTESTYRRLLAAPDAVARLEIFNRELVEPFYGLVKFFGGDGAAAFAKWGMTPEQYAPGNQPPMTAIVEALAEANAWARAATALETGKAAFAAYADRIQVGNIVFGLCIADMSATPQAGGYSGFGAIPGWIMTVYGDPNVENLKRVEAATVHELHHTVLSAAGMRQTNMMLITVGEYMVMEGLAESFAAELYGHDLIGPWVTAFDDSNLEQTKALFHQNLKATGFNEVRRYIFGDPTAGLPTYAGYALGYRTVQAYLKRTGKSVVESTFVPADEIIEMSGYFA